MSSSGDSSIWVLIGTAIGGMFAGVGSVFGLNKARGRAGEGSVSEAEVDAIKAKVVALEVTVGQHQIFLETMNQINQTLRKIEERMGLVEKCVARIEGYEEGRKARG
jgi:hypothetical protein